MTRRPPSMTGPSSTSLAATVPSRATTRKLLLVVARDGTVAAKEVELGPVIDGGLRVIRSGLAPGDRVVIEGTQMAFPGSKVTARRGRIDRPESQQPEAAAAAPAGKATLAG